VKRVGTRAGIAGAEPADLMPGQLLHLHGMDSVTPERRSEEHPIERVRAGVLEQSTVDVMRTSGLGERLRREGMRHAENVELRGHAPPRWERKKEVVKDLIAVRRARGWPIEFEAEAVRVTDVDSQPQIPYTKGGQECKVACDFVAGCDGSRGWESWRARRRVLRNWCIRCTPDRKLRRVRLAQRISWWMTTLLHRPPDGNTFGYRRQLAMFEYVARSKAADFRSAAAPAKR
jgi:2-polyprenyl-6-methoxyphenol hydroxylase-like FAD-dependent oxidoreductase